MTIALALSIWLATAMPEVARLQVVYPSATFDGTCTMIWAESADTERVLYFLTSLRFFRDDQGDPYAPTAVVRIALDDARTLEVPREVLSCRWAPRAASISGHDADASFGVQSDLRCAIAGYGSVSRTRSGWHASDS
jgi:hypothetical protein